MPKVSVVITAYNYARYLRQAIDSVLNQSYQDFEIVLVDDGSTDHTVEVLEAYKDNEKIKVIRLSNCGLSKAANIGIRASTGEYVIRMDADDYFDHNILLVLSTVLYNHPKYDMVFPDYYRVNKHGEVIDQVRQLKVNDEVKLLDRSALAAGALYRRSCFDELNGYNEELRYQEDYDYWIRFIDRFHVHNEQLPLMYYRQHSRSMSTNTDNRMAARRYVKHKFVAEHRDTVDKKILGVLPITMENRYRYGLPLVEVAGRPLMAHLMDEMMKVDCFDNLIVDTEDMEVARLAEEMGLVVPFLRPRYLAGLDVHPEEHYRWLVSAYKEYCGVEPEVFVTPSYNNPLVRAAHIQEAVDTFFVYKCDSVISVSLNDKFNWRRGGKGLQPVNSNRGILKDERIASYEERGGLVVFSANNLKYDGFLGERIGHIELNDREGLKIESDFTLENAERELSKSVLQIKDEAFLREQ